MTQTNLFGILRFRWRYPSLLGVYCVTGCPQKTTWSLEAFYLLQPTFVFPVVERRSRRVICCSPVLRLAPSGHWCVRGSASRRWNTPLYVITLSSLLIRQEVLGHVVLFCSSFGLLASGLCGQRETIGCSEAQHALHISCWTRSSYFLSGGWRRRVLL
jgi:hypothetical protein